jgi:hypothetical protein
MNTNLQLNIFVAIGMVYANELIGTHWCLKYSGFLDLTDLWWRILPSRHLLANYSFRKEHLFISSFLMPTGLRNLWPAISKTIAISPFYIITNVKLLFPFVLCGTRHDKQLGYSNKEKKSNLRMRPFMQKPLNMQHICSKLFSLHLSKLHAFYNSCLVNHVTNPNSNEYKLTAIVLDIAGHRFICKRDYRYSLMFKI